MGFVIATTCPMTISKPTRENTMNCDNCQRFDNCNAPVCPLDKDYLQRNYLPNEPVCYYMMEGVKIDGIVKIIGAIGLSNAQQIQRCIVNVESPHRPPNFGKLAKKLARAKLTKSRLSMPPRFN